MNLIDTIDRMAIQASRYRTTRLSAESRKRQADDDSEAIETVRAMQEALREVHKIVSEAAITGFNPKDGDWADRLFRSQYERHEALRRAEGNAG